MASDTRSNGSLTKLATAFALSKDFSYLLLALAVVSLGFGILTPIMPKFATDDLQMDPSEIGAVYSLFAVAYVIVMLPAGYLCDRMGRKPLIIAGTLMFGMTTFALVFITNSSQFALLRTLEGVGAALVVPAAFALTVDIVPEHKRGIAMGAEGTAQLIGGLGGPGLGGLLAGHVGFYYPFYTAAALSILCAVLVAFIREPRNCTVATADRSLLSMFGAWRRNVRHNRTLVALTGRGFVMGVVQGLWNLGLVLFWYERIGMSELEVGIAMSIGTLAMLVGALPFGALCDSIGRRPFMLIGGTVMSVGLMTNVFASEAWHVFLIVGLTDLGASMSNPAVGATLADVMLPAERGRVMGAYQMIQGLGNIVGFSVLGFVYDAISPEAPIVLCSAALAVATLIIFIFVQETRETRAPTKDTLPGS
jgi:MFS family permease